MFKTLPLLSRPARRMVPPLAGGHRDRMGRDAGKFASHPARLAAIAAGEKKWRGPECPQHGDAPRHTSSGHCGACDRERSALQAVARSARRERYVKLADRPERQAAIARGDVIYWGPLCLNGHAGKRRNLSPRYTSSNRCVVCAQSGSRRTPPPEPAIAVSRQPENPVDRPQRRRTNTAANLATQALRHTKGLLRGLIGKAR
eukprot:gene39768-53776_t